MRAHVLFATFLALGLAGPAGAQAKGGGMVPGGRTLAGPGSLQLAAGATERVFTDPNLSDVCVTVAVAGKAASVAMTLTGATTPSGLVPAGGSKSLCVEAVQFVDLSCGVTSPCLVQWRVDSGGKLNEVVEIIQDNVAISSTVQVYTVPADRRLVITDLMIADEGGGTSFDARILRDGVAATSNLTVRSNDTFRHSFAKGIEFAAGQAVSVVNGDTSGPLTFYLRGYLTTP